MVMFVLANFSMDFEIWLEYGVCKGHSGHMGSEKSIIWDDTKSPTADPQITHKLCRSLSSELFITCA